MRGKEKIGGIENVKERNENSFSLCCLVCRKERKLV